jgi:hypothetical protein
VGIEGGIGMALGGVGPAGVVRRICPSDFQSTTLTRTKFNIDRLPHEKSSFFLLQILMLHLCALTLLACREPRELQAVWRQDYCTPGKSVETPARHSILFYQSFGTHCFSGGKGWCRTSWRAEPGGRNSATPPAPATTQPPLFKSQVRFLFSDAKISDCDSRISFSLVN